MVNSQTALTQESTQYLISIEDESDPNTKCKIVEGGFKAKGNCDEVLDAYERYLEIKNK